MFSLTLENLILAWLIFLGLVSFLLMGYDKLSAKLTPKKRVAERKFWLIAAIGGFGGVVLGAIAFHHKVAKAAFWPPIILATALWIIVLYFLKVI